MRRVFLTALLCSLIAGGCVLAFAAGVENQMPAPDKPHAPMEFFGVGPEMFQDRSVAWAKAIGTFIGELISQFGIQAAAVTLLISNLRNKKQIEENAQRLDRQRKDIEHIAGAVNVVTPSTVAAQAPTP